MSARKTTMSSAPHLGMPSLEPPKPVLGCHECLRLATARLNARSEGDYTTVTDCDIKIRKHAQGHQ
ncbi:hypothetical protein LKL35_27075 [Streptomyces sp. ET3-23]|uniref:hypothetical protein n=1 Tax=Streptomyces sp. ET3-23 TaxID=2885643 RepID=UPI001D11119F|nr:hypothetical protein [Streptomyces sp. ET3-23]MCC2279062.1 hypothetical protein [Streptomyces sp. ET3-23]